ncbi:TFIIH complex serine/threonine-protein kinase subunit KIN28 [Sugiyamaella lignohabitans]|uniref:[RNA-polymerase]-subunit kinase n=1 Tax=Sugiyamaella lignohabitans TaxID=796027 RepID=A0A167EL28_9ASCO|nr:TFIIH complex serine/threonine-protein kinase subunit KIN28 [Sugiyamaella lignohabitans]ANB14201.1 TFIIH complex serine/threonine-protein kinase subunit KIN28 [Sugiyamaella lignohabitans]
MIEKKVGEGTYAVVYVGRAKDTKRQIAIKMIKVGEFKDGLDMSAIREIKFLQELRHPNVIELLDVFSSETNLNIVLEFLPADLEVLIKDKTIIFSPADIKSWLLMTLRGLHHCHRNFILHRDLKPNNLLLSPSGHLKLADFGLARALPASPRVNLTPRVVTRWYRAPELLFESRHYTTAVDIWSVGIIFAELMLRTPYLPGASDLEQIDVTFRALGTPTEATWPGVSSLPGYKQIQNYPTPSRQELQNRFLAASDNALDLMNDMIHFDPAKRIDTTQALLSKYFTESPPPTRPENLPKKAKQDPDWEEQALKNEEREKLIQKTREARMRA